MWNPRPWLDLTEELYSDGLFAADRDGRQPVVAVSLLAADNRVELFLERLRDRPHAALADLDLVDRPNRRDFGRGAAEEDINSDVEQLAWNHLL